MLDKHNRGEEGGETAMTNCQHPSVANSCYPEPTLQPRCRELSRSDGVPTRDITSHVSEYRPEREGGTGLAGGPVQIGQPGQPIAAQHGVDRRGRHPQVRGDACRAPSGASRAGCGDPPYVKIIPAVSPSPTSVVSTVDMRSPTPRLAVARFEASNTREHETGAKVTGTIRLAIRVWRHLSLVIELTIYGGLIQCAR